MKISVLRAAPAVIVALSMGACAPDTETDAADAAVTPDAAPAAQASPLTPEEQQRQMAMITELQAIDQQLGTVRDRAMADPEIAGLQAELVTRIEAAMEGAAPGVTEKREEFDALIADYNQARAEGDQEKVAELGPRLQTLDQELGAAQSSAMQQPEIQEAVEEFQESLFDHMRDIDPVADSLLDRGEELNEELQEMMGGGND